MNSPVPIPSAETISGYERLGIVGILLLVLVVGLGVILYVFKEFKHIAGRFFEFINLLTKAFSGYESSCDQQHESHVSLHERLDHLLSCTRSGCPVFEMRKKQQKDAARAAEGNPVPLAQPHEAS